MGRAANFCGKNLTANLGRIFRVGIFNAAQGLGFIIILMDKSVIK
jgi:hypothetical protein